MRKFTSVNNSFATILKEIVHGQLGSEMCIYSKFQISYLEFALIGIGVHFFILANTINCCFGWLGFYCRSYNLQKWVQESVEKVGMPML